MTPSPRASGRSILLPLARLLAVLALSLLITLVGSALYGQRPAAEGREAPPPVADAPEAPSPFDQVLAAVPTLDLAEQAAAPPTATPPPDRYAGRVTATQADCGRTLIYGTLHDGLRTLDGVKVRLWWPGAPPHLLISEPSGLRGGAGGYELLLDTKPRGNEWLVAPVDEAGNPLGAPVVVSTTDHGCEDGSGRQVVRVDFQRGDVGLLGLAGPTVTPLPTPAPDAPPPPPEPTPLPTPDGQQRALDVPILMFHYVSVPPPDADIYRHDLSVGPDLFRAHLVTLRERGYSSVTMEQLRQALVAGAPLPEKPVVLTFDDGYLDNYENAFPILVEEGFVGTFFVIADRVERGEAGYMTWDQLREMQAAGMEIGSHTNSHPELPIIPTLDAWHELAGSRLLLEERLGAEVRSFCYPAGKFDAAVVDLARQAGYGIAVTTVQGAKHSTESILTLSRVRVRGGQFPPRLMATIESWLGQ